MTAFLKWGWPLPPNKLYVDPKIAVAEKFFNACESGKGYTAC